MTDTTQTLDNSIFGLFTYQPVQYIFEFLAIYLFVYFVLGFIFNRYGQNGTLRLVRILDTMVLIFIVIYVLIVYGNKNLSDIGSQLSRNLSGFKAFAENSYSIFSVFLFIILLYCSIYLVKIPMTTELKPVSITIIENLAIILLISLFIIDFFKYVLNIDLLNYVLDGAISGLTPTPSASSPKSTGSPNSTINSTAKSTASSIKGVSATSTPTPQQNEVFNIRNNLYTYDEAKEVCSIFGAQLANYDQIESAYNDGGEWCNYGWTDGQMALFPTQKASWTKLQGSESTKNKCGRPGINGGYIKNKNVRFGVNCYGKKPAATAAELSLMSENSSPIPVSAADKALQSKLNYLKQNADKFLLMNSFNKKEWSEVNH